MTDADLDALCDHHHRNGIGHEAITALLAEARRARASEAGMREEIKALDAEIASLRAPCGDEMAREIRGRLDAVRTLPWRLYGAWDGSSDGDNGIMIADPAHPGDEISLITGITDHPDDVAAARLITNAPADIAALLADRQHMRYLLADRLEETALAAEERRRVVAWLRAEAIKATRSMDMKAEPWGRRKLNNMADAYKQAADAIEAGRHARPREGKT